MRDDREDARKKEPIRIVDRRPFTGNGEPRQPDAPREDAIPAAALAGGASAPPAPAGPAPGRAKGPPSGAGAPAGAAASREDAVASGHFRNLVLNLATTAAANLGDIPNPFTRQTDIDLEGARQVIDLIRALQSKTRGNLDPEETELLESLLYELQIKFVQVQSRGTKPS